MYTLKDISVVIPTYNRPEDLNITLKSLFPFLKSLNEIIIVDQSKDNKTKNLIKDLKTKNLKYVFSKIPSISMSRNIGVKNVAKSSKFICFLDDDVTLGENYFYEILKIFEDDNNIVGVGAYNPDINLTKGFGFHIENFFKRIFFLSYPEKNKMRIISAYGNTFSSILDNNINSQWLPGVNMFYRKEVFKKQQFDNNLLGYTVVEDIDFTYRLFKKYPNGLIITPQPSIIHRASPAERYPTKRLSFVNQIDHFYFNYKNLNKNLFQRTIFIWSLLGIFLLRFFNLFKFKKQNYLKFKFFLQSLFYCITYLEKIKAGKVRDFEKEVNFN